MGEIKRGVIVSPKHKSSSWVLYGRWDKFFGLLESELGYKRIYSDHVSLGELEEFDVILSFKSPTLINVGSNINLGNLDYRKKLICYTTDIHYWDDVGGSYSISDRDYWFSNMRSMFDRADVILCPYKEFFLYKWGEYSDKFVWFPQFFNRLSYESLSFNENPIKKCLFTSYHPGGYYPFRDFLLKNINGTIDRIDHPTYNEVSSAGSFVDREFANKLNEYLCSVSSGSKLNYSVAKYFEIPATGCLLLGKPNSDIHELGFKDGVNYLSVDESNVFDVINEVVGNLEKFTGIRKEGRNFVLNNHTEFHRFELFKKVLEDL